MGATRVPVTGIMLALLFLLVVVALWFSSASNNDDSEIQQKLDKLNTAYAELKKAQHNLLVLKEAKEMGFDQAITIYRGERDKFEESIKDTLKELPPGAVPSKFKPFIQEE